VATSTDFGSAEVLSIAARRGPWLGVVSTEMPNGKLAWVHRKNAGLRFRRSAYSLHADLSGRRLELRKGGRLIRRISVAIGRPGSETPSGRFAITDKLRGGNYGPYYGCCILALNAHQPKLPAGWQGGNRIAIHGTDSPGTIGSPASAGCLRAADSDLEILMRRVPLGTPVFIKN
jgi:lipoprotein-anchoring transpeptidase ErfK/SrfK